MDIVTSLRQSARLDTIVLPAGLVLAATGCATLRGEAEILPASLCFLFALFAQIGGNFAYRHYNAKYNHGEFLEDVSAHGLDTSMLDLTGMAARLMLILSATVGLAILTMSGWWTIAAAVVIYGLIAANYATANPLYHTPWAPIVPFLLFGVIGIGCSAMIQVYHDNPDPFSWYNMSPCVFTSIALGFLAANIQIIHSYSFINRDTEIHKQSFCVKFGRKASIMTVFFSGVAYLAIIWIFVLTQHIGDHPEYSRFPEVYRFFGSIGLSMAGFSTIVAIIPFLMNCRVCLMMRKQKEDDLTDYIARKAMYSYFVAGLLVYVVALLFGDADNSHIIYYLDV